MTSFAGDVVLATSLMALASDGPVHGQAPAEVAETERLPSKGTPTRSSHDQARKSGDDAPLPVIGNRILTEVDVEQRPA